MSPNVDDVQLFYGFDLSYLTPAGGRRQGINPLVRISLHLVGFRLAVGPGPERLRRA